MVRIIKPKRPKSSRWRHYDDFEFLPGAFAERWIHDSGLFVLSSVDAPDRDLGPQYHISISNSGKRATTNQALVALKAFDMEHSDEDNHTLMARQYWQPVADHMAEYVCPCKKSEAKINLDDGDFVYIPPA